jgi:hypothetical protein
MKRLFRIFELTKNEQRVVFIVMLVLLVIAFVGYQRRVQRGPARRAVAAEAVESTQGRSTVTPGPLSGGY